MTTDPPPRRKWNITRWLLVFALVAMAWSGWRTYTFRSALAQAKALGWTVGYTDPVELIQFDWRAAFEKATWLDGVTLMVIPTSEAFEQHRAIVHRLQPRRMQISNASTLRDLSALRSLVGLQGIFLYECTGLANVDALKNLSALTDVALVGGTELTNVDALNYLPSLQNVELTNCTGLTNMDGLTNLSALRNVNLYGCTGLTKVDAIQNLPTLQRVNLTGCTGLIAESIDALKRALPNTTIFIGIFGL